MRHRVAEGFQFPIGRLKLPRSFPQIVFPPQQQAGGLTQARIDAAISSSPDGSGSSASPSASRSAFRASTATRRLMLRESACADSSPAPTHTIDPMRNARKYVCSVRCRLRCGAR